MVMKKLTRRVRGEFEDRPPTSVHSTYIWTIIQNEVEDLFPLNDEDFRGLSILVDYFLVMSNRDEAYLEDLEGGTYAFKRVPLQGLDIETPNGPRTYRRRS